MLGQTAQQLTIPQVQCSCSHLVTSKTCCFTRPPALCAAPERRPGRRGCGARLPPFAPCWPLRSPLWGLVVWGRAARLNGQLTCSAWRSPGAWHPLPSPTSAGQLHSSAGKLSAVCQTQPPGPTRGGGLQVGAAVHISQGIQVSRIQQACAQGGEALMLSSQMLNRTPPCLLQTLQVYTHHPYRSSPLRRSNLRLPTRLPRPCRRCSSGQVGPKCQRWKSHTSNVGSMRHKRDAAGPPAMARLPLQLKPNRVGSSEVIMTTSMGRWGTNLRSQMRGWNCRKVLAADGAKPNPRKACHTAGTAGCTACAHPASLSARSAAMPPITPERQGGHAEAYGIPPACRCQRQLAAGLFGLSTPAAA